MNDGLQWPPVKWRTDIIIIFGWGNRDIYIGFHCLFITAYFRRPFFFSFSFFVVFYILPFMYKLIYRKIHMNRCIILCVNTLWEDKRHTHKYLASELKTNISMQHLTHQDAHALFLHLPDWKTKNKIPFFYLCKFSHRDLSKHE